MRRGSGRVTRTAFDKRIARSRRKKSGDDIEQSGFPAAARSDDANKLARRIAHSAERDIFRRCRESVFDRDRFAAGKSSTMLRIGLQISVLRHSKLQRFAYPQRTASNFSSWRTSRSSTSPIRPIITIPATTRS